MLQHGASAHTMFLRVIFESVLIYVLILPEFNHVFTFFCSSIIFQCCMF